MSRISLEDNAEFQNWEDNFVQMYHIWKPLNDAMKRLKEEGKGYLAEVGEPVIATDRVMIKSGVTNRFNSKEFRAKHPDLYDKYLRSSESITVTPLKR